jgi:hypothetical protein
MARTVENPYIHLIENWKPLIERKRPLALPQLYHMGLDVFRVVHRIHIDEAKVAPSYALALPTTLSDGLFYIGFKAKSNENDAHKLIAELHPSGRYDLTTKSHAEIWKTEQAEQDRFSFKIALPPEAVKLIRPDPRVLLDYNITEAERVVLASRFFEAMNIGKDRFFN